MYQITQCLQSKKFLVACLTSLSGPLAYLAILGVLILCGLGLPIPEDITIIAAGILASLGHISLAGAFLVTFFGVLLGDSILFFLGRKMGDRAFKLPVVRLISQETIAQARKKVLNNSKFICFLARFLPGLRASLYLTAGVMGVSPRTFLILDGFAALISVPVWIYVGYWVGNNWDENIVIVKQIHLFLFGALAIIIPFYLLRKKFPIFRQIKRKLWTLLSQLKSSK